MNLYQQLMQAGLNFRSLTYHSDGRWIAKTGGKAPKPKKLYQAKTPHEALSKLLKDNQSNDSQMARNN
jgi:hypothetical protein